MWSYPSPLHVHVCPGATLYLHVCDLADLVTDPMLIIIPLIAWSFFEITQYRTVLPVQHPINGFYSLVVVWVVEKSMMVLSGPCVEILEPCLIVSWKQQNNLASAGGGITNLNTITLSMPTTSINIYTAVDNYFKNPQLIQHTSVRLCLSSIECHVQ